MNKPQHDLDAATRGTMTDIAAWRNTCNELAREARQSDDRARAWEAVARNLAASMLGGREILHRQMAAHGLVEVTPLDFAHGNPSLTLTTIPTDSEGIE
jgi:hypothetical protein